MVLQTVHDSRISGEADYLVVALKGYYDNASTQEVDLTLVPKQTVALGGPTIGQALTNAIASAQKEIQATYAHGEHTLATQQIDVQIGFAVTWDESAGVNKWAILPVSISASQEFSSKTTNTITVTFKKPS